MRMEKKLTGNVIWYRQEDKKNDVEEIEESGLPNFKREKFKEREKW